MTDALVGDALVYVGNSHVDAWSNNGLAPEGFEETRLFRLGLR